jgi:hypothetical protein
MQESAPRSTPKAVLFPGRASALTRWSHQERRAAALRYLHTVNGRDRQIADALDQLAQSGDAASLPGRISGR